MYPIDSFVFYCFMITCCVFGAIKFYQLKVPCNFPVYLTSCIKYKLIRPTYVTARNFRGFAGFLKNQSRNFFYDQHRDFFHPQNIFTVMILFLVLFDILLLKKVFSNISFLQSSSDNFFHVCPYFL